MKQKCQLKYRVLSTVHPGTGKKFLRPVIAERDTYSLEQVVEFALSSGYVRGHFYDVCGTVNGFIEAVQKLGMMGKAVKLGDWLRVHGELTGTVDEETRRVGERNDYRVVLTPLRKMSVKASAFDWVSLEELEGRLRLTRLSSGAENAKEGEILRGKPIWVSGMNLMCSPSRGDSIVATWAGPDGGLRHAALEVMEESQVYSALKWPTQLDDAPDGTVVTLTYRIHVGKDPEAPEQVAHISAPIR